MTRTEITANYRQTKHFRRALDNATVNTPASVFHTWLSVVKALQLRTAR